MAAEKDNALRWINGKQRKPASPCNNIEECESCPKGKGKPAKRPLSPESSDIVYDVTNEEGPPDNERQEYGHGSAYQSVLTINRPTPAEPVWGKQTQAYDDKIFLEVKVTHRMPMAIAF
jgi:hypothetical protein